MGLTWFSRLGKFSIKFISLPLALANGTKQNEHAA